MVVVVVEVKVEEGEGRSHSPIVIYLKASQLAAVATRGSAAAAGGRVAVAEQGWVVVVVVVVVVVTVMRNLGDGLRRNQRSRCSVPSRPYQARVPAAAMGKSEGGSLVSPPRGGRQGLPIRASFPPPRTSSSFAYVRFNYIQTLSLCFSGAYSRQF